MLRRTTAILWRLSVTVLFGAWLEVLGERIDQLLYEIHRRSEA